MSAVAIHPDKCVVFTREVIYSCGLKVSGQGVSIDPVRLEGLKTMPAPTTVGDVWRFKASVGWIRPENPLLSVAEGITKFDYRWRGPGQVIHQVTPMVFIVETVGVPHVRPFPVHTQRLCRFVTADLDVTEQLRIDVQRDHPSKS